VIVSVCFDDEKASGIDQLTAVRLGAVVLHGLNCGMLSTVMMAGARDELVMWRMGLMMELVRCMLLMDVGVRMRMVKSK
jgi:hypothetical protein